MAKFILLTTTANAPHGWTPETGKEIITLARIECIFHKVGLLFFVLLFFKMIKFYFGVLNEIKLTQRSKLMLQKVHFSSAS